MNEVKNIDFKSMVYSLEKQFSELCKEDLKFKQEALFALSLLSANKYLSDCATSNPNALVRAILNIATVNISLNPALQYAYLVPRATKKGLPPSICLDISYRGLLKIATDSGSIKFAKAEIVKEKDEFIYRGALSLPTHNMNPFSDRGQVIGVYCIAKTCDNDFLVGVMSREECEKIKSRSMAPNASWTSDFEEMCKKTIIKREQKTWPKTERLANAISILNEHEGIDFQEEQKEEVVKPIDYEKKNKLIEDVAIYISKKTTGMSLQQKGEYLKNINVKTIGDLKRKSEEELQKILAVEIKQITTEDIPF